LDGTLSSSREQHRKMGMRILIKNPSSLNKPEWLSLRALEGELPRDVQNVPKKKVVVIEESQELKPE